jgi:hypothetical protein
MHQKTLLEILTPFYYSRQGRAEAFAMQKIQALPIPKASSPAKAARL